VGEDNIKRVLRRNLEAAMRRGDLVEARAILARRQAIDPLSLETRGLELELLLEEGNLADAEALAAQLGGLFPASPRVHFLAGRLDYKRKRWAAAAEHFRESDRLHPSPRAARWRGKALTEAGQLDDAEAILAPLAEENPRVLQDLAWLHERRGDVARAARTLDRYLERYPDNHFARESRLRLRARAATPEEIEEEVQGLGELGEPVAPALLEAHLDALLAQGRTADARRHVDERLAGGIEAPEATTLGWVCYKRLAYDLAVALFARSLPRSAGDPKLISALEAAARRAGRVDDVVALYEQLAVDDRRFYGRARRLRGAAPQGR
jgi:tetratricopeptide (TPR) repeat protein